MTDDKPTVTREDREFAERVWRCSSKQAAIELIAAHRSQHERKAADEAVRKERERLRSIGARMSNVCWNLARGSERLDAASRASIGELQEEWDAAIRGEP